MQSNSIATNTLLMPNIPSSFFNYPTALEHVRAKFDDFGILYAFVAMKGFGRLMIIYEETICAIKARDILDKTILSWEEHSVTDGAGIAVTNVSVGEERPNDDRLWVEIRLYYGQHNPINPDPTQFQLQVPQSDKNFLISPPGSPCDDWKQTMESPPNTAVLASDMTHAVAEMSDDDDDLENFRLESPMPSDEEEGGNKDEDVGSSDNRKSPSITPSSLSPTDSRRSSSTTGRRPILKIVNSKGDHPESEHVPVITVQDWDGDIVPGSPKDKSRRRRPHEFPKAKVLPTARPPVRT
ncbi:Calcipressin [Phascolomyces articulosus]|uniref:Calcipressin n=1 Tax=Phascolomyces articulosus TaxID=60185 RepID=A0AAD5KCR7_9FUNG|nr:Calcipressin [Phascolomyces articulosus]